MSSAFTLTDYTS